tara:strand:+ start:405 stop:908 length:504 start_codon:yes stop_codon:yes gene_type:complete
MIKRIIYGFLWISIGFISAIDVYWSIVLQDVLIDTEVNPIGRYLIRASDGQVALFMLCKVMGLVVVLGVLTILYNYKRKLAWYAILGVAAFQFWLLWYLNAAGTSSLQKAEKYKKQRETELLKFQPTITPVMPADTFLKRSTDFTNSQNHAQSVESEISNKSTTTRP